MPYPLPLTRTEAYLAYKAGVIQQSDLKPSLAVPRNGIDAWLAYWTGLAADYPKREDGTPHILQEEEAYIAYLCGVINEYPEKCLRRVGAYLRYLISARWGRPDHPLNREELYLSLIKTQFIPSGDPSSDIVIGGTAKAPFVDVKMYGDTFQQSYTGKNLLSLQGIASPIGITGTVKDGSIVTVTGTVGSSASNNRIAGLAAPLSAGTYTLTIDHPCDHVINLTVGDAIFRLSAGETSKTAAITADTTSGGLFWGVTTNTTYNETFKLQLVAGSTPDYDYEPYVGGIVSPNPDYPQPIQTVTGRQVVKVTGKNLFVPPNSATSRGVTFTKNEDGSFNISGKAVGGEALCSIFTDINLKDGESLTLSSNVGLSTGVVYRVEAYNGNTWLVSLISQTSIMPKTITIPQNATRLRYSIGLLEGREVNLTNVTFQLEKGTATDYEPYSSNDYEINLGNIELCKLGTYQDYIYKDGDDWKVHKAISTITVDGSEDWAYNGDNKFSAANISGMAMPINADALCYCATHIGVLSAENGAAFAPLVADKPYATDVHKTVKTVRIKDIRFTEAQALKTWLSQNNTTIYYVVATATDTTITNTALIAQLEALVNGGAENGTTYIKVLATGSNLPGLLYVEAPKYE